MGVVLKKISELDTAGPGDVDPDNDYALVSVGGIAKKISIKNFIGIQYNNVISPESHDINDMLIIAEVDGVHTLVSINLYDITAGLLGKRYIASLSQSGISNPTVNKTLQNSTGATVDIERNGGSGLFKATFSLPIFTELTRIYANEQFIYDFAGERAGYVKIDPLQASDYIIYFESRDLLNVPTDELLNNTILDIWYI